jgi:translation initiation factor IF-2
MLLEAEMLELKTSSSIDARCTVIEAQVEQGRGPTATVIVRMGTLKAGDVFICGNHWGKVKQLINDLGKPVKEAGPSMPVKILGLSGLPNAGDELVVMDSEKSARLHSEERLSALRDTKLASPQRTTLENLFASIASESKPTLKAIVKCDVQGSLEAVVASLREIPQKKITLDIIHSAVGPITESDVLLASASNAVIIGFGTKTENSAAQAAKREGVQIKLYSIIYELLDQVRESMSGMLAPSIANPSSAMPRSSRSSISPRARSQAALSPMVASPAWPVPACCAAASRFTTAALQHSAASLTRLRKSARVWNAASNSAISPNTCLRMSSSATRSKKSRSSSEQSPARCREGIRNFSC